jgi:N-methylhydantoinase A
MEELGTRMLIVPKVAPIYCAYGMLFCDLKHNYSRSYRSETVKADLGRINALYGEMEKEAVATLLREGGKKKDILIEKSMDMRYYGQIREKEAVVPAGPVTKDSLAKTSTRFHEKHHKTIGYSDPNYPTQIIRLHLSGTAKVEKPRFKKIPRGGKDPAMALKGTRRAYFAESKGFVATKVYDGDKLLAGNVLSGPSIVEEKLTTLVILPKMKVHVDPYGNYVSSIKEG